MTDRKSTHIQNIIFFSQSPSLNDDNNCAVEPRKNTISFGQFQLKRAKKLGFEQSSKIKDV